jgi:DNA-binding IclR family transcriptional regulator
VLDVLEIVLDAGACKLSDVADAAGLTPTTALRHLRALEARGYLRRDGAGVFRAGPTVLRLAATVRDDGPLERLITVVQPHLDELARTTGESAYLALLDGTAVGAAFADVGTVTSRHGAVEPDIAAVSLAFGPVGELDVALSIVGPSSRFDPDAVERCRSVLVAAVTDLAVELGLDDRREPAE